MKKIVLFILLSCLWASVSAQDYSLDAKPEYKTGDSFEIKIKETCQ